MESLHEYLYGKIKPIIETWKGKDIYAISFFVYDDEDDPMKPTMTLGYNTIQNFQDSIKSAYDEGEAKWNYAYWLQNYEYEFGYDDEADMVNKWIMVNKYHEMEDNSPEYDENMRYIGKGPVITQKLVEELIIVSKRLHKENVIKSVFGSPIPIIIHELEYYDAIANQTKEANPEGLADEFAEWVMSM